MPLLKGHKTEKSLTVIFGSRNKYFFEMTMYFFIYIWAKITNFHKQRDGFEINIIINWRKGSPQETMPEWENSSLGFIEAVHQW